jgi:hypothetical protein
MLKKKKTAEIQIPEIEGITNAQKSKCHKIIHSASAAVAITEALGWLLVEEFSKQ